MDDNAELPNEGDVEVDCSGQGLTMLPSSLLSRENITVLNISGNNMKALSEDIAKLRSLVALDVSKNPLRCNAPDDYTGLPLALATLANLRRLNISECGLLALPNTVWRLTGLRELRVARNKLGAIAGDVGRLAQLETLDVEQCGLIAVPPELVCCERLQTLLLYGNPLDGLPDALGELPRLSRVALNPRGFCRGITPTVEALLRKGMVSSEHMPPVLYEIPAMVELNLDGCYLNCLPELITTSLTMLHLDNNLFTSLPDTVGTLINLETLTCAHNSITAIPKSMAKLCKLTRFVAHHNKIASVAADFRSLTALQELDLSYNRLNVIPADVCSMRGLEVLRLRSNGITVIPEAMCKMVTLRTLELSENSITTLPNQLCLLTNIITAHTYDGLYRVGLWLTDNPIVHPPQKIWRTDKTNSIWRYLEKSQIREVKDLQKLKIVVLGDHQCGKTSFIRTTTDGRLQRTKGANETTQCFDVSKWVTKHNVQLVIYDVGTHPAYLSLLPLIMDHQALFLVCFDAQAAATYESPVHLPAIQHWLKLIEMYAPHSVVQFVATKSDMYSRDENEVTALGRRLNDSIANFIEQSSPGFPIRVVPNVVVTSCRAGPVRTFIEFQDILEVLATDKKLFPHNQRYVPQSWLKLGRQLVMSRKLFLRRDEVQAIGIRFNVRGEELWDALRYLNTTGRVLYNRSDHVWKQYIFPKIVNVRDFAKCLMLHDIEEYMHYENNRIFRCCGGMNDVAFGLARESALTHGFVSQPMLDSLIFDLNLSQRNRQQVLDLIEILGIGYRTMIPDIPTTQYCLQPVAVFPRFMAALPSEQDCTNIEAKLVDLTKYQFRVSFPRPSPIGVFERISIEIQKRVATRCDFKDTCFTMWNDVYVMFMWRTTRSDCDELLVDCYYATPGETLEHIKQWFISKIDVIKDSVNSDVLIIDRDKSDVHDPNNM